MHRAGAGREHASDEVDQGGLARAVGADQADLVASPQNEVDVTADMQAAKGLAQLPGFEQGRAHEEAPLGVAARLNTCSRRDKARPQRSRGTNTMVTSMPPMMKSQW